ncbi:MAG: hypothetical protein ACI4QA_04240 [Candidatus Spyradosoma sp.]
MKSLTQKSLMVFLGVSAFCASGCQLWYQLFPPKLNSEATVLTPWKNGDGAAAALKAQENADKSREKLESDLIWQFEAGAIASASGDFATSEADLEWADELVGKQPMPGENKKLAHAIEDELGSALSGEGDAMAALENIGDAAAGEALGMFDSAKAFLLGGNTYMCGNAERIMLPVYRAYNAFGLKDAGRSSIALKKLENYQRDALAANLKQIENDKEAFKNKKLDSEVNALEAQMKEIYGPDYAVDRALSVEGVYVNPFAAWLGGIYFLNKAEDASDLESARNQLRFASEACGRRSKIFQEDELAAEAAAKAGKAPEASVVYVVYEGGTIPKKSEKPVTVRVPQFALALGNSLAVQGGGAPVIPHTATVFLSTLVSQDPVPELEIEGVEMETVMDFEASANKELMNRATLQLREAVDEIAARAISRGSMVLAAKKHYEKAKAKADAEDDSKKKKEKQALAAAALASWNTAKANVGMPLAGDHKDCRNWQTLPREIRLAKFAVPESGKFEVFGKSVDVRAGDVNIVRVRKVTDSGKPMISVFSLSEIVPQEDPAETPQGEEAAPAEAEPQA